MKDPRTAAKAFWAVVTFCIAVIVSIFAVIVFAVALRGC